MQSVGRENLLIQYSVKPTTAQLADQVVDYNLIHIYRPN